MNEIEIYLLDNSEEEEGYWMQKGRRPYIIVKIDNNYYNLIAYDYEEFYRESKETIQDSGYFCIEPNLILVKELTNEGIILAILHIYNNYHPTYDFFGKLKPEKIEFELKRIY
ncbi:hypothetical protein KHQ81_06085 [Mycoplasmatota bacterium]|nr:hypothetical protein KHQ81_06085 [Mycoplasmatota bacterium]